MSREVTPPPRCPKCGLVMYQQFEPKIINAFTWREIPNGAYICFHCDIKVELDPKERK